MAWLSSNGILFFTCLLLTLLVVEYISIMTSQADTMPLPPVRSNPAFLSHPLPKLPPRFAHIPPQINPKGWPLYPLQDSLTHSKQLAAKDLVDQDLTSPPVTSASPSTLKDFRDQDPFQSSTTSHPSPSSSVLTWAMTQPMNSSVSCNTSVLPHDGYGYRRRIPQAIVLGAMKCGTGTC